MLGGGGKCPGSKSPGGKCPGGKSLSLSLSDGGGGSGGSTLENVDYKELISCSVSPLYFPPIFKVDCHVYSNQFLINK